MKTPNNNIFSLIKSMSPAEKRYFKRHYASIKNRQTDLFDAINNQKEYSEQQIRKTFAGTKVEKNLKVYKIQLSDLLLKSLSSFHYKEGANNKVQDGLKEIDLLFSRRLFKMGLTKTKKLKQFCTDKFQQFALPSVLLKEQAHQANFNLHDAEIITLEEIKKHLHQNSLFIDNKIKLAKINQKLQYRNSWVVSKNDRPFFQKILNSIERNHPTSLQLDGLLILLIKAKCLHSLGELDEAQNYYENLAQTYFHKSQKSTIPVNYFIQTFTGVAKIKISQGDLQAAETIINQLKVLAQENGLKNEVLPTLHYLQSLMLLNFESKDELKNRLSIFLNDIYVYHLEKEPDTLLALSSYASALMQLEEQTIARSLLIRIKKNNSSAPTLFKQFTKALMAINNYQLAKGNHSLFQQDKATAAKDKTADYFYQELISFFNDLDQINIDQHPHLTKSFTKLLHFYKDNELLEMLNKFGFKNWLDQIQTNGVLINTK